MYVAVSRTPMEGGFTHSLELGRKIWNLDYAIWTLQGRHRSMVKFADYAYDVPTKVDNEGLPVVYMPARVNGEWMYIDTLNRSFNREKVEDFKTIFYRMQGWDTESGYPTRRTLAALGLGHVADELEKAGKLGSAG